MSNKYLEKIAKTVKEGKPERSKTKALGAAAIGAAGLNMADKERLKGNLTGRERFEHTTTRANAKNIREVGLKPADKIKKSGLTQAASDMNPLLKEQMTKLKADNKGLVFASRPGQSRMAQAVWKQSSKGLAKMKGEKANTVKFDAPTWKDSKKTGINKVVNPELQLSINNVRMAGGKARDEALVHKIVERGVHTNKGDIQPKWAKGSSKYQRLKVKELGKYVSKNKARAAKGWGKAAVGVAVAAAGATKAVDYAKSKKR